MARKGPYAAEVLLAPVLRWTPARKFWLVQGLRIGTISRSEARRAHGLTDDELRAWVLAYQTGGPEALRVGRGRIRKAA